jgi:hypothetical protein
VVVLNEEIAEEQCYNQKGHEHAVDICPDLVCCCWMWRGQAFPNWVAVWCLGHTSECGFCLLFSGGGFLKFEAKLKMKTLFLQIAY